MSERQQQLVLMGLCALLYLPLLGHYGMWDPWRTHYGEIARQMVERKRLGEPVVALLAARSARGVPQAGLALLADGAVAEAVSAFPAPIRRRWWIRGAWSGPAGCRMCSCRCWPSVSLWTLVKRLASARVAWMAAANPGDLVAVGAGHPAGHDRHAFRRAMTAALAFAGLALHSDENEPRRKRSFGS